MLLLSLVAQLGLTLCYPMDCSSLVSSVYGLSQARILEWVVISFSGHLPDPGIKPASPALADGFFTAELPGKPSLAGCSPWGRRFRYDWACTQASIRFPLPLKPFYELLYTTWASSKDKNRLSCTLGRISSNDNGKVQTYKDAATASLSQYQ